MLRATPGRMVAPGTYYASEEIKLSLNLQIIGNGSGTVFSPLPGSNVNDSATLVTDGGNNGATISNMVFDYGVVDVYGILVLGNASLISSVVVENYRDIGIHFGCFGNGFPNLEVCNATITNCPSKTAKACIATAL